MGMDSFVGIFALLFAAAISVRAYLVYRKNGRLPVILNSGDAAHDYVHKVLAGIIVLEGISILMFRLQALSANLTNDPETTFCLFLGPIRSIETPTVQFFGLVIAYLGLLWTVVAQHQMGQDWRIGIDVKHETSLVTRGLYTRSRHPIYLGFIVISIGLFFAVPNVVSLVCAVLTTVVLPIEARLEEEFLLSRHGDTYREYLAHTRRWI